MALAAGADIVCIAVIVTIGTIIKSGNPRAMFARECPCGCSRDITIVCGYCGIIIG